MAGYMWAVAEMTKAEALRIDELECVNQGASRCKFVGEWKPSSQRPKA
jgi:predicted hydrocarbon binding protein